MIEVYLPANVFYPELPGSALQYFRYAPYLKDRGISLNVLTPKRHYHEENEVELDGMHIRRFSLPNPENFLAEHMALIAIAVKEIGDRRLIGRACIQPAGTFAANAKSLSQLGRIRTRRIPLLRHFTEVPEPDNANGIRWCRNRLRDCLALSPYSRLLMCSATMGRAFQNLAGISNRRIEVLPNGIDLKAFVPTGETEKNGLRRALNLSLEGPLVVSVCSIIPRKGVDLLVAAWARVSARHPDATLVIVGSNTVRPTTEVADRPGIARYIASVREAIAQLPRPERVILTGDVANVTEYYQAADLFVFASLREGLPSAVLEAMSSGLPSVLAPFHGFPGPGEEYGFPGTHFLPVSHDPDAIAHGILRLIASTETRSRMGDDARVWIERTQSIDKAADQLAAIYHSLLPGR